MCYKSINSSVLNFLHDIFLSLGGDTVRPYIGFLVYSMIWYMENSFLYRNFLHIIVDVGWNWNCRSPSVELTCLHFLFIFYITQFYYRINIFQSNITRNGPLRKQCAYYVCSGQFCMKAIWTIRSIRKWERGMKIEMKMRNADRM